MPSRSSKATPVSRHLVYSRILITLAWMGMVGKVRAPFPGLLLAKVLTVSRSWAKLCPHPAPHGMMPTNKPLSL